MKITKKALVVKGLLAEAFLTVGLVAKGLSSVLSGMWHEAFVIWLALQISLGLLVASFIRVGAAESVQLKPSRVNRVSLRPTKLGRTELLPIDPERPRDNAGHVIVCGGEQASAQAEFMSAVSDSAQAFYDSLSTEQLELLNKLTER